MSSFTEPLVLDVVNGSWQTNRPLVFDVGAKGSGASFTVPAGFTTDLASVPRLLWPLFPRDDPHYAAAAVLHDRLCTTPGFYRHTADAIFLEAMGVLGVAAWRRWTMYVGVRAQATFRAVIPRRSAAPLLIS